jgi:small subunit ribosomal protein S6
VSERYEVLFIVRPDVGEAGMKEQAARAQQVLEQQGATEITVHDWGTRDLAYHIEGHTRGAYVLIEYESMPPAVRELERTLKLSDQVLRFMSVRQAEGMAVQVGDAPETGGDTPGEGAPTRSAPPPSTASEASPPTPLAAEPPEASEPQPTEGDA